MSYEPKLKAEIENIRDDLLSRGETVNPTWVAHTICNNHKPGLAENEHAEMWLWCGYKTTRDYVRRAINQERVTEEKQPLLPGFKHLQLSYVVERDGDTVEVSVFAMTDDEIAAKAAFYRSMGAACFEHADELVRFRDNREQVSSAAE